tara:strand:- start:1 stop:1080 length:1080 start_codon:yes stop_codon:yes gene_type:complete
MDDKLKFQSSGVSIKEADVFYGKNHVIKNISIDIKPGEFFTFLGPSGCGKTTLLRLVAGFESASKGKVIIGENDVTTLPPWKRNVGMVFQNYALWPHMTVFKNVAFGLEQKKIDKKQIFDLVKNSLELVGLEGYENRRPSQLSGGQQQRVALARTLVVKPTILLLDEPLSNLDAKLRIQMRKDILKLQRKLGITTIFVTHDQEEANVMSDRMAIINNGNLEQLGEPEFLYNNPINSFTANFLGTTNTLEGEVIKKDGKLKFVSKENIEIENVNFKEGKCKILLRPQNFYINNKENEDQIIRLKGTIIEKEFMGNIIRYTVNVKENKIFVDIVQEYNSSTYKINDEIELSFKVSKLRFIK